MNSFRQPGDSLDLDIDVGCGYCNLGNDWLAASTSSIGWAIW